MGWWHVMVANGSFWERSARSPARLPRVTRSPTTSPSSRLAAGPQQALRFCPEIKAKIGEVGRDSKGHWRPGYLAQAELVTTRETATGDHPRALRMEAKLSMKGGNYPPYPERLGLEGPRVGG